MAVRLRFARVLLLLLLLSRGWGWVAGNHVQSTRPYASTNRAQEHTARRKALAKQRQGLNEKGVKGEGEGPTSAVRHVPGCGGAASTTAT